MTVNLCAASKKRREPPITWSILDTLCCLAARCAARSRLTRSSIVSCAAAPIPFLRGNDDDDDAFGGLLLLVMLGEGEEDDFAAACGVLDVNRVASATLRGLLLLLLLLPAAIFIF
jgi:hypothetical protein